MNLFIPTFIYILKLFSLSVLGYFFFKQKYISKFYKPFLIYTVDIALPVLIFHRLVFHLTPDLLKSFHYLMLICVLLILAGFLLGKVILKFISVAKNKEYLFLAILGFSNVGYLPIPLMEAVFHGNALIQSQIYIFFFIIPFNLLIWSIGIPLSLNEKISFEKFHFKITTPFVTIVLSLLLSFILGKISIPHVIEEGMNIIGESVNPAIMIMLGGAFSEFNLTKIKFDKDVFVIIVAKLILFPLIAIPLIILSNFNEILKLVLLVEVSVPPAVNLVIINKRYANEKSEENLIYLLSSLVYTYIFSVFSIPLLISLFRLWK